MEEYRASLPVAHRNRAYLNKSLACLSSHLGVEIEALFEYDYDSMALTDLVGWCKHYRTRFLFLGKLLELRGSRHLEKFLEEEKRVLDREGVISTANNVFNIFTGRKINGSLNAYREIYEAVGNLDEVATYPVTDIMDLIDTIHSRTYLSISLLMKCVECLLRKDMEKVQELRRLHDDSHVLTTVDKYRKRGGWCTQLLERSERRHQKRLSSTSSCPDTTIRTLLTREVRVLNLFEKYTRDLEPTKELQNFLRDGEIEDICRMICLTAETDVACRNERVKSQHTRHHATQFVNDALSVLRVVPELKCRDKLKTLSPSKILSCIDDKREQLDTEVRRHFYVDEILRITRYAEGAKDYRFLLILRILKEIGLRVNAIASLKTRDVTAADGSPREKTAVYDKGKKLRHVLIGEGLQEEIKRYIDNTQGLEYDGFLFPQKGNPRKHVTSNYIRKRLSQIAEACDIHGIHIHPHAFRHTLVNSLVGMGNDIHKVSKFMGHASTATTETYYWTSKISDISENMTIPWLNQYNGKEPQEGSEYTEKEVTTDILLVCISMMTLEQKQELKKTIPNIEEIIEGIKDSSTICGGSSVATTDMEYQKYI